MTVQFGLSISTSSAAGSDPIGEAIDAEAAGFDFVSANDHFHATGPRHELWTLMSWIAASTSRIAVASRVLGVPFRNPAVVAKMAETLDRLSGGRLILGLGAGAADDEFRALGLPVRPLGERIDGLEEAIGIMRGLWLGRPFSFAGRIHRVAEADFEPKPGHQIPIWLGTHGPRGVAMAGRLADGWIPSIELAPPDRAAEMIDRLMTAADAAGRDPQSITRAYNLEVNIGEPDPTQPHRVSGSPDAVAARLVAFTRLGFNAFNLIPFGPGRREQVAQLGRDVLPTVRAAG